jgi:U4/U6.U5 tri-snRNP-associated protein 1
MGGLEQRLTPRDALQVLSGKVRPGQISDPASGNAVAEREPVALTPVLGGGQTPLMGDRKVEAMLGIRKPPAAPGGGVASSMGPPPPRKRKAES